jgi:ribonuclease HI
MISELLTLQFDGGSRGNPGPAGIGVVIMAADGTPIVTLGRFIGPATNNVAEYTALIVALEEAAKLGAANILIRGDSELIIKQMKGEYRVKNPDLRKLHERASALMVKFKTARFEHNLRDHNELADKLANMAMNKKGEVTELP